MPATLGSNFAKRRLALTGAAAGSGVLITGCATSSAPPIATPATVSPPRVQKGDRWSYEDINQYNRLPVGRHSVQVTQDQGAIVLERRTGEAQLSREEYTRAWDVLWEPTYDTLQRFEQPVALIPAQLVPGSRFSSSGYYRTDLVSQRLFWSEVGRVIGWQRITVPAGTFDAALIERRISFNHSDYARGSSRRVDRIWYAPSVNRWVQREWTGEFLWGNRPRSPGREDWVLSRLTQYQPAA
jgi:hypothetical protein